MAALIKESVAFEEVNEVTPNRSLSFQAIGLVQQNLVQLTGASTQRDAKKSIHVLSSRRAFVARKNDHGMRQFQRKRKKEDVPLPHASSTGFES